ncbi:lycopene cyclase family protein [Flavobacterium sp.]|uniref:lycopene cyclase family protein n=1 Tax=Flavobacterium sp. TaxID=239 RepID=UPI00260D2DE7|nr:lycopene cyclase family protein [Flavobacterium sp.]MDD3003731.1 lycopene cyclase family protein [Flavobacterium sp.]
MNKYNYIFAGAGLSSLMTVYEMIQSGLFLHQKILLIDADCKKTNDRTWSFWEKKYGEWDDIVSHKYETAFFKNKNFNRKLDLQPYHYKTVCGIDFYTKVFDAIRQNPNIEFLNASIHKVEEYNEGVQVITNIGNFHAEKVFNSIYNPTIVASQTQFPLVQQHFIGWFIQTTEAVFTPETATFMDFSVNQKGNTRFMYVLPTSETEALIEYTLFSPILLKKEEYETEIENYIQGLGISTYQIIEKEAGNIPMTCYPFWKHNTKNILHIGSAGGWTKASTGFTFKNTIQKSKAVVRFVQTQSDFRKFHKKDKFWWYDLLLIDILFYRNEIGSSIFSAMFKKSKAALIYKFLDEETTFWEDLKVIWQCPKRPFLKAVFCRIFANKSL